MVALMASMEMDSVLLRLREGDHVGVLKRTLKGGTELVHGSEFITTAATIPAGHKIALKSVTNGEPVRKYG
ncbi:MAG TPA: galactonate dehydratase, partial [Verrucomicrobiales bacterium]|nr:galactonate dehydratase [Verrucomicrobiales bacterium]